MRRSDRNAGSIKALIVLALLAANIALAFRHPERSAAESRDPVASTSVIPSGAQRSRGIPWHQPPSSRAERSGDEGSRGINEPHSISFNFAQHEQQQRFTADRRDPSTALGMTKLR